MKKFISVFMSFLLAFSLSVNAFAAGTDLDENYLSLDEINECFDKITYPAGYDTIISARVFRTETGVTTKSVFCTDGCADIRPAEAAALAGEDDTPRYVDEPYEQKSYYDYELGTVVTERIYFTDDRPEKSSSDESTADARSSSGAKWFYEPDSHTWSYSGKVTNYYAEGFFEWDGENVTVSNADGDYDFFPSDMEFLKDGVSIDYGGIFTKYAQVTYKLNYLNNGNKKMTLSVSVKVNAKGEQL